MKAIEQYFPVVLFIMLYKVVLTFESVDEILKCDHTEQYFPAVLFIMLYKVVLTFQSVYETLWCDHSNETPLEVVLHGIICFSVFYKMEFFSLALLGVKGLKHIPRLRVEQQFIFKAVEL